MPGCGLPAAEARGAREELESLANDLGIHGKVLWLGLRRDMPALLDAADGFVLASAWEGMPLVLAEAMAMEKPVVATDVGGVRELVGEHRHAGSGERPGSAGRRDAGNDAAKWGRTRTAGKRGAGAVVRQFSIDAAADRWEALYRQLTGAGSRE